jgi:SAM-dependent methyltransferase
MGKSMSDNDRKDYEKKYHNEYFKGDIDLRTNQKPFYTKDNQVVEHEYMFNKLNNISSKKILLYGTGQHFSLIYSLAIRGAHVVATDISQVAIEALLGKIKEYPEISDRCTFVVCDCENLPFKKESFDICFGRSILHHLDLHKSLSQMHSVLKSNGKIAFFEPLGVNPIINLYRKLTPQARTPYEHPFTKVDLECFRKYFSNTDFSYFYGLSLFSFVFRVVFRNESLFKSSFKILNKIDKYLIEYLPQYRYLCWDVVIYGERRNV